KKRSWSSRRSARRRLAVRIARSSTAARSGMSGSIRRSSRLAMLPSRCSYNIPSSFISGHDAAADVRRRGAWRGEDGMDLDLKGQCAVVAGAAQGIGRAIARAFAAEGALVALIDRDERVKDGAPEIGEEAGTLTLPLVADVTDYARLRQCAGEVEASLG